MPQIRLKNFFSTSVWKKEENKFKQVESRIKIPNAKLRNVDCIVLSKKSHFHKIPAEGGCYWIWTNEPIYHRLHRNKTPKGFSNGEVIYNGIAKDNVRSRIMHHLSGDIDAGWSGVSIDIYPSHSRSHKKKAYSRAGKVPFVSSPNVVSGSVKYIPIRTKELLLSLNLSRSEKRFINKRNRPTYFFRNGINFSDYKHKKYKYKIYYITGLTTLYLEFIEKRWRKKHGTPKLCSYSSGR